MRYRMRNLTQGFTLIEIMIVIAVIGALVAITYSYAVPNYRERTYLTRAESELHTQANALTLYVSKYNDYPADVSRGIAPGTEEFLQSNGQNDQWPNAPWPGSYYDYDRWDDLGVIQISIRFCDAGDDATCKKNFPKESWVTSSWDSHSAVYFCIKGQCRSDHDEPVGYPGYCVNCGGKSQFF
jgi:prepilin-type N-terminal cleavage/methylation domain-containing protein